MKQLRTTRLVRLLKLMEYLRVRKTVTVRQISEYFEVSMRQIYRDIDTLREAMIPIDADRGQHGGGVRLNKSYFKT